MGAAYDGEWGISAIVDDRAERLGDRQAVVGTDGRMVTYGELRDRTQRIARLLLELGVEPGDRVATMLDPPSPPVEAAFGSAWAGAVEVPVNTDYKGLYLEHVLRQTGAKAV